VKTDVDLLERHFDQQRDRVRHASRELQRLLDDPTALQEVAAPPVSEVVVATPAPAAIVEPLAVAAPDEPSLLTPPALPKREPEPPAAPAPSLAHAEAESVDEGPSTETIDLLEDRDAGDDAYLAELRKAMTDESPLGPREEGGADPQFDIESEPNRSRFGRRR
jgi:hypothetical protein